MPNTLHLEIADNSRIAFGIEVLGPLEVGRQRRGEPEPFVVLPARPDTPARLITAFFAESQAFSGRHALLTPRDAGFVQVRNLTTVPLQRALGEPVPAGTSLDLAAPFALVVGSRQIRVELGQAIDSFGLRSLEMPPPSPGQAEPPLGRLQQFSSSLPPPVLEWLQHSLGLLQSSAGAANYLEQALEALVGIVELASAQVLLYDGHSWTVLKAFPKDLPSDDLADSPLLQRVLSERRTCWQEALPPLPGDANVAAPLLHADGRVIGALHGSRTANQNAARRPLGPLDALIVEQLASGIASSISRRGREKASLTQTVRMEQAFGATLSKQLETDVSVLEGRSAEVTLLHCTLLNYPAILERSGTTHALKWLGTFTDEFARIAMEHGGVLLESASTEFIALWGAPLPRPDAADSAARAALQLMTALPAIEQQPEIQLALHSAEASVGLAGTRFRLRYTAQGDVLPTTALLGKLATYLQCRCLITAATRSKLGATYHTRRIVKLRNQADTLDVYQLAVSGDEAEGEFYRASEQALELLERGDATGAIQAASQLIAQRPNDGPLRLILSRAAQCLAGGAFNSAWTLPANITS